MNTARLLLCIAVAVAAAVTRPAFADTSAKEQAKLRKITLNYAKCVVAKHHAAASEAVLATISNSGINRHYPQIVDSNCLGAAAGYGVDMRFPNDTYQYALADALVNAEFAAHGDTSFADRLPLAQPVVASEEQRATYLAGIKDDRRRKTAEEAGSNQHAIAWLMRYGECVVRHDPESTRYLILTPPETPEEGSRLKALQPSFGACLEAGTIKFNRITIRGTVAINYYRLARATAIPAGGSSH